MNIYPAIDILGGKAVRLRQGRRDQVTVYGHPVAMAERWAGLGAKWLHIVDLDGAFEGEPHNHRVVQEIAAAFPSIKVQLGGGIRNMEILDRVFNAGVQRAVLGTSAVTDTAFVSRSLRTWQSRIAAGIDAQDGVAKVSGWTATSQMTAIDLARQMEQLGVQVVIYTDISRDGVLAGPNLGALRNMIDSTSLNVIASGGIAKTADIETLAKLGHPRLDGVIIGKALYEELVDLKEALEISEVGSRKSDSGGTPAGQPSTNPNSEFRIPN